MSKNIYLELNIVLQGYHTDPEKRLVSLRTTQIRAVQTSTQT